MRTDGTRERGVSWNRITVFEITNMKSGWTGAGPPHPRVLDLMKALGV